jgi:eukaryotic-like serine/threonine-protein kinase
VAAQVRLAPDERFVMEMSLTEGDYRLRGPQLPFSVNLRVSQVSRIGHYELSLRRPPNPESVPVLRSGAQVLTLTNDSGRELQIRLERTAGRQSALTAASASTLPLFRELFPEQVLSPGQIVSITKVTLLLSELPVQCWMRHRKNQKIDFDLLSIEAPHW